METIKCPKCGSSMRVRFAKQSRRGNRRFYGCSRFPQCRGTRDISDVPEPTNTAVTKSSSTPAPIKKLSPEFKAKFLKLIRYYRECIQTENLSDIDFFGDKEGEHFVQCPAEKEWLSSEKQIFELNAVERGAQSFGRQTRGRKRASNFYYGFPLYVYRYKDRHTNVENAIVRPFLLVPIEYEKNGNLVNLKRTEAYRPQVNTGVLRAKSVAPRPEQQKAFMEQVLEKWKEGEGFELNFRAVIEIIKEEFGEGNFIDPQLDNLSSNVIDLKNAESGFYSSGILFYSQGSQYTFGVEEELEEIGNKVNADAFHALPVLEALVTRQVEEKLKPPVNEGLLAEITMLNDEQRAAIRSAFENTLTIVTGPPGTGKSQVVLNIIANAIASNQTVLFGSKNHKAVDVVLERLDDIQKQPVILKFGQNAKESLFAERLLAAVDKAQGYDQSSLDVEIKELFEEMQTFSKKEVETWNEIKSTYESRNKVVDLECRAEKLEERLSEELKGVLSGLDPKMLASVPLKKIGKYLKQIRSGQLNLISRAMKMFGRPLELRGRLEIQQRLDSVEAPETLKQYFQKALVRPIAPLEDIFDEFKSMIERAELLNKSSMERSLKSASAWKISSLEDELSKIRQRRIGFSPKYLDAYVLNKFKKLPVKMRQDIADYKAMVQRIETDRVGGETAKKLREEKKTLFESVVQAFPSIAVTNLSVRHAVPLKEQSVDLIVLDEASQCDIASAIPMLVRAKRAVIIGDKMQLPHVSTISLTDDQQIQAKHQLSEGSDQRFLYSTQSLFDLAKTAIGTAGAYVALKDHFRSRAEIIDYSNDAFYGGELRVWTDYRQLKGTGLVNGIFWHDVKGRVIRPGGGSAFNLEEANKVIDVLKAILPKAAATNATVGVVTPFREQENKIKALAFKSLDLHLLEAVSFEVDTAHGYQGDERDIIIFSPVISAGTPERTMGFLANTPNVFNVAITRPRAELHVVGDRMACANCKVSHLSKFAEYMTRADSVNLFKKSEHNRLFDSVWEEIFYKKLLEKGLQATPQLSIHQYRLDLAIENHNPPIDIEIDGETYHREITGQRCIDDVKRDIRLNLLGWVVKRFWVYELKYEMDRCVNEILELVRGTSPGMQSTD